MNRKFNISTFLFISLLATVMTMGPFAMAIEEPLYGVLEAEDDVEFLFSSDQSVIEVRSSSRVGYYDFGKNRRRIEDVRKRWDTGRT